MDLTQKKLRNQNPADLFIYQSGSECPQFPSIIFFLKTDAAKNIINIVMNNTPLRLIASFLQLTIRKNYLNDIMTSEIISPQKSVLFFSLIDPLLFSGTLRINLDPLNFHTDDEFWKVPYLALRLRGGGTFMPLHFWIHFLSA